LRTASLLNYLASRYEVDLITFRQAGDPDPATQIPPGLTERISVIHLPPTRRGGIARAARNALRLVRGVPPLVDRFSGFEAEIVSAIGGVRYELGVIEHFWCAAYGTILARSCGRTVLDLHNIESVWHERNAAAEKSAVRLGHQAFARAARRLEQQWFPGFKSVLTTSDPDKQHVLELVPAANVTVYPNAIPAPERVASTEREEVIAFSGNMEYHPNISAVRFFRLEIWPLIRDQWPKVTWRLIGKNPQAVRPWTQGDSRIQTTGPVADAIGELAKARIAVVPILAGSGTRLKILEAWAAGLPVVSTPLGAEGLSAEDGRHLLLAPNAPAFAKAVGKLLESPSLCVELGCAGRELLLSRFTWESVWKTLDL
jgi:glycosyltransferase involved in cell wall biosynthesis